MSSLALLLSAALVTAPVEAPAPGTISVDPAIETLDPAESEIFANAVADALVDANFTPIPAPGKGRYIARLSVTRTARGLAATKAPKRETSGGIGNWGAALFVPMASNKSQLSALVVTELRIQIVRRDGQAPVWSGRALTVQAQGTPADAPSVVAAKLATAIVGHFPEQTAEAASVP